VTFEGLVAEAMAAPIEGWRFPFLEERLERDEPSWDWTGMAAGLVRDAGSALDHGTGGGEVLADVLARERSTPAGPAGLAGAKRRPSPAGPCGPAD
jgi:hypothetical protein